MSYLIEALTLGFLYGVGPCTVFCAPILVPLIMSMSNNSKDGVIQASSFVFGKTLSYIFLGLMSGYVGYLFGGFVPTELIGVLIIALGLFILLRKYSKRCLFLTKIKGGHLSFFSGIIVGLRPCPPLLALLSLAVLARSAFVGGLMGFLFGLGTLLSPLMILGFLAGKWAEKIEFRGINIKVCGLFLVVLGLWKVLV